MHEHEHDTELHFWEKHGKRVLFTCLSGLFLLIGLIFQFLVEKSPATYLVGKICYLGAVFFGVWYAIPTAFYSLRRLILDIHFLMVIAVIGALAIQAWIEAATVAFLFSLALFLEEWSLYRARKAITALMELTPTVAHIFDPVSGISEERAVEEVTVGQIILIRPGEKIPLDGIIIKGSSSINQSAITGESLPVMKEEGEEIYAGTLNGEGSLECRVTKVEKETILARIIEFVDQARLKRSENEQWVDTFARFYTPLMLLFSLVVILVPPIFFNAPWPIWIYHGLVLLVIACPCALVISTPVSIVSGLTASARNGVLIKGGIFLEQFGKMQALALDKTGTLTSGRPEVQEIALFDEHTEDELMTYALALEKQSEHPLAQAILRKADLMGIPYEPVSNFQIFKGKGASALIRGKLFWIGSHRFMHEMAQETEEIHQKALGLEDAGHSVIAIGREDRVYGLISVADSPRKLIRETMTSIRKLGCSEIVMLTGDNEPTARALALHAGIESYYAELLPEEKVEVIQALQKKWGVVGMVGDGINDAPAMATASIGIVMGRRGSAVSIESADVVLIADDLSRIPWLMKHSRKTLRIIKQNIAFSLGVKALFIALALVNLATLWMAVAVDTGATLLVVLNALRLIRSTKT